MSETFQDVIQIERLFKADILGGVIKTQASAEIANTLITQLVNYSSPTTRQTINADFLALKSNKNQRIFAMFTRVTHQYILLDQVLVNPVFWWNVQVE
ncbi:hypothetical protein RTP6_005284 [Batrachochytrium dendrobatidis]